MDFEDPIGVGFEEVVGVKTGRFQIIGDGIGCLGAEEFLPAFEITASEFDEVQGFDFLTVGDGFFYNGIAVLGIGDFGGRRG